MERAGGRGRRRLLRGERAAGRDLVRRQDYVDNRSRVFVGHVGVGIDPALATRVADADLLLVVGPRLGEMTTGGYTLVEPPLPRQTLVHVHAGAEELGRVYQPALAIHAGSPEFAAAAGKLVFRTQSSARRAWLEAARGGLPGDARASSLAGR